MTDRLQATAQRHDTQRAGIVTAVELATGLPRHVAEVAAHHAMMATADALRNEAKALADGKVKGHVSTGKELTTAASRLAIMAVKIPGALTASFVMPGGGAASLHPSMDPVAPATTDENGTGQSEVTGGSEDLSAAPPIPADTQGSDPWGVGPDRGDMAQALVNHEAARLARVEAARAEAKRLTGDHEGEPAMFQDPAESALPAEIRPQATGATNQIPGPSVGYGPGGGPHAIPAQRVSEYQITHSGPVAEVSEPLVAHAVESIRVMAALHNGGVSADGHIVMGVDYASADPATAVVAHVAMVPGMDGTLIPALSLPGTVTPPVPSLTPVDPFADPGGRLNQQRLTYGEFRTLAASLSTEASRAMSVSKVESLTECGMRYAFDRMARRGTVAAPRPQWSTIGGNAFHAWVAAMERQIWVRARAGMDYQDPGAYSSDEWITGWQQYLDTEVAETLAGTGYAIHDIRASARGVEGYDWWRVNGEDMCRRYVEVHDARHRNDWVTLTLGADVPGGAPEPALEVEYFLPIDGDLTSHGFMDIVRQHRKTGLVEIVDVKSGKSGGSSFQLASYAHAAMRELGIPGPIMVSNYLARTGEYTDRVEAVKSYSWDDLVYDYSTAAAMDRQGLFMAKPTTFCGGCPFEAICPKRYGQ